MPILLLPAALLKFEAFISQAFKFQRHPMGSLCNDVILRGDVRQGERGPLLLFNPLCSAPSTPPPLFRRCRGTRRDIFGKICYRIHTPQLHLHKQVPSRANPYKQHWMCKSYIRFISICAKYIDLCFNLYCTVL